MILPKNYLARLLKGHAQWDVIQGLRRHLTPALSTSTIRYDEIYWERDTRVANENYWAPFYRADSWNDLRLKWRYTCTYLLSVEARLFREAGRFRRTFFQWGFEDTDFGYRLDRAGARFYLEPTPVYHLTPVSVHSERFSKRHQIAARMARVFYLNNLDPEIYVLLRNYMQEEFQIFLPIIRWLRRLLRPELAS